MRAMRNRGILLATAVLAAGACNTEITGLADGETISVRVDVSGGIAGADYAFALQDDGVIVGIRCDAVCEFQPGDTLGRMTPAQRAAVKAIVLESGLPDSGHPADFGTRCCDQFTYRVIYTSGRVVRSFTGSSEALPDPLRRLVRTLHLAFLDTPPVVMAQSTGLDGFSLDPLEVVGARVDAGVLEVDVRYGGGCVRHDVDAVAYTAWMESNPVRIGVALTHDDHADACDALVEETLRFDLEPLRATYEEAYGTGSATVILQVTTGSAPPAGDPVQLAYTW